jgi:hypothetical protein
LVYHISFSLPTATSYVVSLAIFPSPFSGIIGEVVRANLSVPRPLEIKGKGIKVVERDGR